MGATRQEERDRHFMRIALEHAKLSKCVRAQYGTVIVAPNGHVVSTGYNGKPAGSCNDDICYRQNLPPSAPKENCCVHSEVNALMFCAPVDRVGGTLYVSGVPCKDCSLVIMQSGIRRLVYLNAGMHVGTESPDPFFEKYGFDRLERVAMTPEELHVV